MKRTLLGVLLVVVLAVAVFILRRGPQGTQWSEGIAPAEGQYLNDSLGVGMLLPDAPGWSFKFAPEVPGGGLAMAVHEGETASVRLYVHPRHDGLGLDEVIRQRRKQIAGLFQAASLDDVIEKVMQESRSNFAGYPAWQWQGMTEPVGVAGEEPQRVMFMLLALERPDAVIEAVGLVAFPAKTKPGDQERIQELTNQVAFILQSFQVR